MEIMQLYLPFNSIEGDRKHDATGLSKIIQAILSNGVTPLPKDGLSVMACGGWEIAVASGRCVIDGKIGVNSAETRFTVAPPNGMLDRIDRVVARLDYLARWIEMDVKMGAPAMTPVPPELQRDEDAYEISLAAVRVDRNATEVKQSAIADERPHESVCGFVSQQIPFDSEALFRQWGAIFHDWMERSVRDMDDFLQLLKIMSAEGENAIVARVAWLEAEKALKNLQFFDVSIPRAAWVEDDTHETYRYRADMALYGVRAADIPQVTFAPLDVMYGNFAPVAVALANAVRVYARQIPDGAICVPTVVVERAV